MCQPACRGGNKRSRNTSNPTLICPYRSTMVSPGQPAASLLPSNIWLFLFFFPPFFVVFFCGFVSQHDGETWESELDFRLLGLLLPCKSKRLECKSHFLGTLFKNGTDAPVFLFFCINFTKKEFKKNILIRSDSYRCYTSFPSHKS